MTDWFLVIGIVALFWLYIFIDYLWNMLFRSAEKETLKERKVPEGRAVYWIGHEVIGQIAKILGPTRERPNPRKGKSDKYFGFLVVSSEGDESVEWVWSNEVDLANMEGYAGRPGMTWMRINPDPADELLRDKEAQIFALKHELKEMYEITENRNKMLFDAVHEAVQKFLPKVTYQPKKKSGQMPPGGEEIAE
jgi:hypothetical protein